MKKKLIVSSLIVSLFASCICATSANQSLAASETSNGYYVETMINDKFNKSELDSNWTLNGAEVKLNYNSIHCISPVGYGSGPIITAFRQGKGTTTTLSWTINPIAWENGANMSVCFGVPSPEAGLKEPEIDCKFLLWNDQVVFLDYQHDLQVPSGNLDNTVIRGFTGLFADMVPTQVSVVVENVDKDLSYFYVEYRRNDELIYSSANTRKFVHEAPINTDGYIGFFWDCVEMDLTDFKAVVGDRKVFEDDLSDPNTLGYPSDDISRGNFHVNMSLTEAQVFHSKVSSIVMDSGNESIKNSIQLTKLNDVSVPYTMDAEIKVNSLEDKSFFGFGVGLDHADTKMDAKNAIGFIKKDAFTAEVVLLKNGTIDRSKNYTISLAKLCGKYQNVSLSFDHANNVSLSIAGATYTFGNVNMYGEFGLGLVDLGATASSSAEMKSFVLRRNSYKGYTTEDVSNSLQGRKDPVKSTDIDTPYVNTQKFFFGRGVEVRDDWDGGSAVEFGSSTPYSGFGLREQYSEFILEFDIELKSRSRAQLFGISFGRKSCVDTLIQASQTSRAFLVQCTEEGGYHTAFLTWGSGCTFDDGSTYRDSEENLYNPSGSGKYHFMVIARNRNVYIYFKEASAPDSDLGKLRALITNVNIDGYCVIVGNNGAAFSIKNYKMVNLLDACQEESELTIREHFESANISSRLALESGSKVEGGKLVLNNSKARTTNETLYETIRFTTYDFANNFKINFSEDKSIIFDKATEKIIIKEGETETPYDASEIKFNSIRGKRFEITIHGDEIRIGYRGGYDPADKMANTFICHTLAEPLTKSKIEFAADGKTSIDDLYVFALDGSMPCKTFSFDEDPDNVNFWSVKPDFDPSKVYGAKKEGCSGSIAALPLFVCALSSLVVLVASKKRED